MTTPRLLSRISVSGVAFLLALLPACSGSGGGGGAPSANIGGGGGRLSIDSGPFAGTWLDLPAGAVGSDVLFRIEATEALREGG